jgi:TolA-binding protein
VGAQYGELLVKAGKYSEAEAELDAFARRYPQDARVARALGKLYRAQGKYRKAEEALRRSIREDASDPQAHYVLAQVLQHENQRAEANKELKLYRSAKEKSETIRILERVENPK